VPFSNEEPPTKEMTVHEYDMDKWNEMLKGGVMQLLILGVIHYKVWFCILLLFFSFLSPFKWAVAVPLLTQFIMGPMKLYGSELFQIYFLGAKIERPFKPPPSPFGDLMKSVTGAEEEKPAKKEKAKPIESKKNLGEAAH